ncbi:MAG: LLM class flavin-dependent oxidoreductase, partial [Acidimicrobiia bacterium]
SRVRLGSLVVCNDLRSPALVAKMAASLDVLSSGRMEIGLGAGWFEAEYEAAGVAFDAAGVRVGRLAEAVQIVTGMLSNEKFSFEGKHYRVKGAANLPQPVQKPRPPIFVGGKGDRVCRIAGRFADGFNTVWAWLPDAYADRVRLVNEAAESSGRDPASIKKTIGLYCLPADSVSDLESRWKLYKEATPGVGPETFDEWRPDKLAGTADQILDRLREFAAIGAEEVILGFGLLPFQIADADAVGWFAREIIPQAKDLRG